jgi:RND family efflux transporter MFP subunit
VSLGQALFEVMDLSALRVPLHIPDRWASQLKEGLKVRLFDRAERLITDEARVSLVSPVVDAQSGTIKVFVSPPPKLKALKPGLFVSAEVILDTAHNTLTLPKHALLYRDDEPWVVLANGDVARLVKLTLGYTQGERVEVRSPLKEGDLVVSFGQRGLEEGAKLKVSERP